MTAPRHEDHECKQADKIARLDQEMGRVNKAVFYDPASVMAQLASMRESVRVLSWLVGLACASVVGQVVIKIFAK
jgi:hypothetical protein